jgi:hypothetical protein
MEWNYAFQINMINEAELIIKDAVDLICGF